MLEYAKLAMDYHWLFSDRALTGEPFIDRHREVFSSLNKDASILDCACGIGVHVVALARRGYAMTGADASEVMVRDAMERAREAAVSVNFAISKWTDLAHNLPGQQFDLILCSGNSIGLCHDEEEMIHSLQGMRSVLKEGGTLLLDSQNWEKMRAERQRFMLLGSRDRGGRHCIPLYAWTFPKEWSEPHVVDIVFIFEMSGRVYYRTYPVTYYPFHVEDLQNRLQQAGFVDIQTDYKENKDIYQVTAKREG